MELMALPLPYAEKKQVSRRHRALGNIPLLALRCFGFVLDCGGVVWLGLKLPCSICLLFGLVALVFR